MSEYLDKEEFSPIHMYTLRIRNNPLFHKVKKLPQKYNIDHPKEYNTPQTPDSDLKILFTSPKKAPPQTKRHWSRLQQITGKPPRTPGPIQKQG